MENRPIDNSYWVAPGKLLAGEYPRNIDNASSPQKVAQLTGAGVSVFIDLTEDGELSPYSQWLDGQIHQRFGVVDQSVPHSETFTAEILDAIDRHIADGRTVYVHCWGGVGRTGTIVGCWLARHGYPGEAALARLTELWSECAKSRTRCSPERSSQANYILNWTEPR